MNDVKGTIDRLTAQLATKGPPSEQATKGSPPIVDVEYHTLLSVSMPCLGDFEGNSKIMDHTLLSVSVHAGWASHLFVFLMMQQPLLSHPRVVYDVFINSFVTGLERIKLRLKSFARQLTWFGHLMLERPRNSFWFEFAFVRVWRAPIIICTIINGDEGHIYKLSSLGAHLQVGLSVWGTQQSPCTLVQAYLGPTLSTPHSSLSLLQELKIAKASYRKEFDALKDLRSSLVSARGSVGNSHKVCIMEGAWGRIS